MFDLEKAITSWRRFLKHDRALLEEDLDELEQHLRDQVPWLMNEGLTEKQAFERALREMGDHGTIHNAYRRVFWRKARHRRTLAGEISWRLSMLNSQFKVALRSLVRHKAYSTINIAGLSIGLACSFLILLWVRDELSFDRYHEHADTVYRVMRHASFSGRLETSDSITKPLDEVLEDRIPEIRNSVLMDWSNNVVLTLGDVSLRTDGRHFDPDVFDVFTIPLIAGDPLTALEDPHAIVISASLASRLFGRDWMARDNVLGSVIRFANRYDVNVTGVFEDVPMNASIRFEFIQPMAEFLPRNAWVENWENSGLRIFVRLRDGADVTTVNAKIRDLIDEHVDQWKTDVFLQPITDMYLRSDFENGVLVGGRIDTVRIFALVGLFILVIACINFINLATARSAIRAREIGVRKSLGATKSLVARQFLGESILTSFFALILAIGVVYLILPGFNELTGKSIRLPVFDPTIWIAFIGLALLTGLTAGSYPALYLSSFSVVGVLRGRTGSRSRGAGLRKSLVVFQFSMSIVLIVGTLTVYRQLHYIQSRDLGVDRDNVAVFVREGDVYDRFDTFTQELLVQPGIVSVAASSSSPLEVANDTVDLEWKGKAEGDNTLFYWITTGYDFVETMKIDLVAGRDFSPEFGADSVNLVVNQAAAAAMGMDDPLGQTVTMWGDKGTIIGVVRDFNMQSLYGGIDPVVFRLDPDNSWYAFIRIAAGRTTEGLASLEQVYNRFNPAYPLDYRFMDDQYRHMYRSESVIGTLANWFAVLAVVIACLGLFGLASFTAEQRTKEIGIRKTMGASAASVVLLLSREYVTLVAGAFLLAAPVAWLAMSRWLDAFAFHVDFGVGILALSGFLAVAIAALTVSQQSLRAAGTDPAVALRTE